MTSSIVNTISKRFSLEKLQILDDAEMYLKSAQSQSEQMIQTATNYCQELEQQLVTEARKDYQEEIHNLHQKLECKLLEILEHMSQNLASVVEEIALKLGYNNIDTNFICKLVEQELNAMIKHDCITIHCSPENKELLETRLVGVINNVTLLTSNLIPPEKLIIESDLSVSEINTTDILQEATKILQNKFESIQ